MLKVVATCEVEKILLELKIKNRKQGKSQVSFLTFKALVHPPSVLA